jgi:flagellar basal-body rod modification protein FlgD
VISSSVTDLMQSASAASASSNAITNRGQLGKQEFLQLLVTQLKNQDPLNPQDPQEFASQLAQFSSLEQLVEIGDKLEAQSAQNEEMVALINSTSSLSLLGRNVVAKGNDLIIPDTGEAKIRVDVGGTGGRGVVYVYDENGREVAKANVLRVDGGAQTIDLTKDLAGLGGGHYTYELEVTDGAGAAVPVTSYTVAHVDGVKYTANGPVVTSGPLTILLGSIVEITG